MFTILTQLKRINFFTKSKDISCFNLLKREKRKYYNNLDLNIFKDNKTFWKRIKPLFSDKYRPTNKGFILIDDNENISESKDIAESLNYFFIKSVDNLDIEPFIQSTLENNSERSVQEIIQEYESHPSIKRIKAHFHVKKIFSFSRNFYRGSEN